MWTNAFIVKVGAINYVLTPRVDMNATVLLRPSHSIETAILVMVSALSNIWNSLGGGGGLVTQSEEGLICDYKLADSDMERTISEDSAPCADEAMKIIL